MADITDHLREMRIPLFKDVGDLTNAVITPPLKSNRETFLKGMLAACKEIRDTGNLNQVELTIRNKLRNI